MQGYKSDCGSFNMLPVTGIIYYLNHKHKFKVDYICKLNKGRIYMDMFKRLDVEKDTQKANDFEIKEKVKCLIIGSGPAGYTAAIYASRANLNPVLYTGLEMGGQLTTTTDVDNYPGYPHGISGPKMMEDFKKQAERFGADIRFGIATAVDFSEKVLKVTFDDNKIVEADAVIIATGATAKYLGLESEIKYAGMGVSACATCDGFFYKGKDVAVVGGGDTAAEEATYLAGLCRKVYLIVRRNELRASKAMQNKVFKAPNIEVLWEHQAVDLFGNDGVEGVTLVKKKGTAQEEIVKIKIDGFFLAIGHTPNSVVFKDYLETDQVGYIKTIPGTSKTNVEGVFAAGDVQDPHYRQAVTAAGSGCMAAIDAERYLSELK
jgi:thioredoxin reductase (NADPH)